MKQDWAAFADESIGKCSRMKVVVSSCNSKDKDGLYADPRSWWGHHKLKMEQNLGTDD